MSKLQNYAIRSSRCANSLLERIQGQVHSTYDLQPTIRVGDEATACLKGREEVYNTLATSICGLGAHVVFEMYPGVKLDETLFGLRTAFPDALFIDTADLFQRPTRLRQQFAQTLGDDPVFGFMQPWDVSTYFEEDLLAEARERVRHDQGLVIVFGTGACRVAEADLLVLVGATRWVLQARQRSHEIGNLGLDNAAASPAALYKTAFFLDWRVGDALRHECFDQADWFLDLDVPDDPRMLAGETLRSAVAQAVQRPFRLVPFFDPGPWGGQWMHKQFGLPDGPPNYAWAFDCVPEENSVLLQFGDRCFSLPAQVLVHEQPEALLGAEVMQQFGAEFPIRFDYLDTMGGGNLSLQVHPLQAYIREHFGMRYTQDESYYILDCASEAHMYLGFRNGIDPSAFATALQEANAGTAAFRADDWVNRLPTHPHDHFSIPAGTIHCSGKNNVVLEISATPYIFTFKLWDWGRMGLDGRPRPVHLQHGLSNLQWDRDTTWVEANLRRPVSVAGEGDGWREERTGLHELEFLETRRHWFTQPVRHSTNGTVQVLCLVAGDTVSVESPDGTFAPMEVHYGETFIVPAAVTDYIVRPLNNPAEPLATMKAYVRSTKPQEG